MKKIELKEVKESVPTLDGSQEKEFKTKDLLRTVINTTPQGGYTVEEMMFRLKLLNLLDKSKDTMEVEDADYDKLSALVKGTRWAILSKFIIDFVNKL